MNASLSYPQLQQLICMNQHFQGLNISAYNEIRMWCIEIRYLYIYRRILDTIRQLDQYILFSWPSIFVRVLPVSWTVPYWIEFYTLVLILRHCFGIGGGPPSAVVGPNEADGVIDTLGEEYRPGLLLSPPGLPYAESLACVTMNAKGWK
jgi:hypothetical protein